YPALCIYYADKGERLWDIAKRYNTSEQLIREENGITTVRTEKETMIMIPCV
ncbi:MAG: LysM peptidoglycan-binding domain-containing protein, partial [Clostridia bacterium]|nr:LysM peptidoglycan-binding domain-containing protein [Clostridia bacterium]